MDGRWGNLGAISISAAFARSTATEGGPERPHGVARYNRNTTPVQLLASACYIAA